MSEDASSSVPPLWSPRDPRTTRTYALLQKINTSLDPGADLQHHSDLYNWSIGTPGVSKYNGTTMQLFWSTVWDECGIVGEKGFKCDDSLTVYTCSCTQPIPRHDPIAFYAV